MTLMLRRFAITILALTVGASSCLGATGTWRCANGTPCAYTPGVGFHCPEIRTARHAPGTSTQSSVASRCSACRSHRPSRPGASAQIARTFRGCCAVAAGQPKGKSTGDCTAKSPRCQCRYDDASLNAPAMKTAAPVLIGTDVSNSAVALPASTMLAHGFDTRPIIFTTGPPDLFHSAFLSSTPSRAPPASLLD